MDLNDLLRIGAQMIQNNSDEATSGIDLDTISSALGNVLGGDGGFDLGSIISKVTDGNFGELIQSWIGQGENAPIDPDQVSALLGEEKVSAFAEQLGINLDSAKQALADALPQVVDQATPAEGGMFDDLLEQVGGVKGAMDMLGKFFG
ncbi:YidB family protein [Nitratifractor sp.]